MVPSSNISKCDMIRMNQFILKKVKHIGKGYILSKRLMRLLHFHFRNQNRPLTCTGVKRGVRPGSSMSRAAKFPFAPAESAHGLTLPVCVFSFF